jgi:hypothetical protein
MENMEECNISAGVHDRATILNCIAYFSHLQMLSTNAITIYHKLFSISGLELEDMEKHEKVQYVGRRDGSKCFAVADTKHIG